MSSHRLTPPNCKCVGWKAKIPIQSEPIRQQEDAFLSCLAKQEPHIRELIRVSTYDDFLIARGRGTSQNLAKLLNKEVYHQ